jgi:aspartyl/asparaginyl beta-hydroxylase (cupin superfamily)
MLKPFKVSVKYCFADTKTRTEEVNDFIQQALKVFRACFIRGTWVTLTQATVAASDAAHDNELFLLYWVNSKHDIANQRR